MAANRHWISIVTRIAVCAGLLLAAVLIVALLARSAPKPGVSDRGDVRTRVLVMTSHPTAVRRQWIGYGTAGSLYATDVPSRITAVVVERPDRVRVGLPVSKGDLLVRLDDSDFTRQVEIASQSIEDLQAQLNRIDVERSAWAERSRVIDEELGLARAEYDRARKAMEGDAAKQREVDLKRQAMLEIERSAIAAREELDKAPLRKASLQAQKLRDEATLALTRQNAERCRITAPIDGVLSDVDIDVGESVTTGQRMARIVDLRHIEVELLLPSSARGQVRLNDPVRLQGDAGSPPAMWNAHISRIAPNDDESTRTMRAFAELTQDPAKPGVLAPGMFVQCLVTAGDPRLRTVVPRRAINNQRLMLVDNGRVRSVTVDVEFHLNERLDDTGLPDVQWAVLRSDLPGGTLVVVDGARAFMEGSPVEPIFAGESMAAGGSAGSGGS